MVAHRSRVARLLGVGATAARRTTKEPASARDDLAIPLGSPVTGHPPSLRVRQQGPLVPLEARKLEPPALLPLNRTRRAIGKREARARDLRHLARAAAELRQEKVTLIGEINATAHTGVMREMPRRKSRKGAPASPPEARIYRDEHFSAGVATTLRRCLVWVKVFWTFQFGVLWDRMRRRDTKESRARRFYDVFHEAGGSFSKIGQQLSMRVDLLPYEYCRELSKLLDNLKAFPTKHAVQAVERATGKPLGETFAIFDPTPIGSASIACVYQAVLKNGTRVAVKVRRPGIGTVFAADLNVMRWVVFALETLSIIRPGYMDNFIQEFATTIMEELDFRMEAYHQTIFRREARKQRISRSKFFSAPRVYYEHSSHEVLVQEFVTGIWMWEILAAVEHGDQDTLARMRQLDIEPKLVAERLSWVSLWGQVISPLFHADPHPANIVVQRGSKLVFIDFGACGTMPKGKQRLSLEMFAANVNKDVAGAVRTALAFMEPMPPIDMYKLVKELELALGSVFRRLWSKRAPWYEKTSASVYFKLFEITRKYDIPANLDTVRAFRANMLYDTLAMRVYPELDPIKANKDFLEDHEKGLRKSAARGMLKRLRQGVITGGDIAMVQDVIATSTRGVQFIQRFLDRPLFSINFMVEKAAFAAMEFVRMIRSILFATLAAAVVVAILRYRHGLDLDVTAIAARTLSSKIYYVALGFPVLVAVRRIMMRLSDRET